MHLQLDVWLQSMILLQIAGTITSHEFQSRGSFHQRRLKHHRWRQAKNSDSFGSERPEGGSTLNNGKQDEYERSFASNKYNVPGGSPMRDPDWGVNKPNVNTNRIPGFHAPDNIHHPGFAPPNNNPLNKRGPGFGSDIKYPPHVIPKKEPGTALISGVSPNFNPGIQPGFGPGMGPGPVLGRGIQHGIGHQPPHFKWEYTPVNDQNKQNLAQLPVKEPPIFPASPAYQNKPALIPVNSQINYGSNLQRPVEWDGNVPNFALPNQTPTRGPPNDPFKISESNKNVITLHPTKIFPGNSGSVHVAHSPFSPHLKPDVPEKQTNTYLLKPNPIVPQLRNSFQGHPSHVGRVSQQDSFHRKIISPSSAVMREGGNRHYEIVFGDKKPEELPRVSKNPVGPVRWTAEEQMMNQKFPIQQPSVVYSPWNTPESAYQKFPVQQPSMVYSPWNWNPQESAQQSYVKPEDSVLEVSIEPETSLDESNFNPNDYYNGIIWNLRPLQQQDDSDLPDNENISLSSRTQNLDFHRLQETPKRKTESKLGHRIHLNFERLKRIFSSSTSVHPFVRNSLLGTLCASSFLNNVLMKDWLIL